MVTSADPTSVAPVGRCTFAETLADHGVGRLVRGPTRTLQVNVGKRCNMACHHCHVEAGPKRTETLSSEVAERVLEVLAASHGVEVLDLTGGAPELNPHFRHLVEEACRMGLRVIDRCNLTVLLEPGQEDTAEFLAAHGVEIVASLPCYEAKNVEKQRGRGAFDKSVEALLRLNALGYGRPGADRKLDLVYNPLGPSLPPAQAGLEARYREELSRLFGVEFHGLRTITNMPIHRLARALERERRLEAYMSLLVNHFNVETVPELMCRSLVSVGYDGVLFDCDFHHVLGVPLGAGARTIWDVEDLADLEGEPVATADHCFGCTAGAGSSCSGALR